MFSALAGVFVIPFYLGLIQCGALLMLIYSGVVGQGLAAGAYLDTSRQERGGLTVLVQEALLWSLVVIVLGGTVYALALGISAWPR